LQIDSAHLSFAAWVVRTSYFVPGGLNALRIVRALEDDSTVCAAGLTKATLRTVAAGIFAADGAVDFVATAGRTGMAAMGPSAAILGAIALRTEDGCKIAEWVAWDCQIAV
jgi:hypothetical protein